MQVVSLLTKHGFDCSFFRLGNEIGYGADGQVFELLDDPNRVIKLSVLYDTDYSGDLYVRYSDVQRRIASLFYPRNPLFVNVHKFGFVFDGERDTVLGKQGFVVYYYTMDKLKPLTDDEKKVFRAIFSHEDYTVEQVDELLSGMTGLEINRDRVLRFYVLLRTGGIKHADLHVRNVMKDECGEFKLIDLDRMEVRR